MPEQRARKYHQDRVAETIREEIDAMILGDLHDPRISSSHVTQVLLNPGGKSAEIYVQVDGGPDAEVATVEGLMAARGWIRAELKYRMGKRHVPDIAFHADRSERMVGRIDELLTRTRKRNKYAPPASAPAPAQTAPQASAETTEQTHAPLLSLEFSAKPTLEPTSPAPAHPAAPIAVRPARD